MSDADYFAKVATTDTDSLTLGDLSELHKALRDGDLRHVDWPTDAVPITSTDVAAHLTGLNLLGAKK